MILPNVPSWILKAIVAFVTRQVGKYLESVDFETVRKDLEIRLRDLVPGTILDDAAVEAMDFVIKAIKRFLANAMEAKNVLEHLRAGDINFAFNSFLEAVRG
jgi:hypothetical protein